MDGTKNECGKRQKKMEKFVSTGIPGFASFLIKNLRECPLFLTVETIKMWWIVSRMGPPEFESESLAPKAKRIDQATPRALA